MRLDPFVYLSKTDILFYLLVVLGFIISAYWALILGLGIIVAEFGDSILARFLISIFAFITVPVLAYWNYRRSPVRIAQKSRMKRFEESKSPEHYHSIQGFYLEIPHTFKEPSLMYDAFDPTTSAFTFGARKSLYIGMNAGLFMAESNTFRAILLHEMGHLENKDVKKTYLASSILSSLKVFLPVFLAAYLFYHIYLQINMIYFRTIAGYDFTYILSKMGLELIFPEIGVYVLCFTISGAIIYALRNQLVRLREFYADARVLEWEKSSTNLEKTLQKYQKGSGSKFELLRKFHPNSEERIQALFDNSSLFIPNLWIAFSIGFLYNFLSSHIPIVVLTPILGTATFETFVGVYFLSIAIIFGVLMLLVSSEFHKFIIRETLIRKTRYVSFAALLNIVKNSGAFFLGVTLGIVFLNLEQLNLYFNQILRVPTEILNNISEEWSIAVSFFICLVFLWFFGLMLVKRSFSKKIARRNFFIVSVLSSIMFFIVYLTEFFGNYILGIVFGLVLVSAACIIIKNQDRKLYCPFCSNKLLLSSESSHSCPFCRNQLYSWATSSF